MKSLVDAIESGGMNLCCLKEENLYLDREDRDRQIGSSRTVRRCRICGSRHYRMKAETLTLDARLSGPNLTRKRSTGKRDYRMIAKPR